MKNNDNIALLADARLTKRIKRYDTISNISFLSFWGFVLLAMPVTLSLGLLLPAMQNLYAVFSFSVVAFFLMPSLILAGEAASGKANELRDVRSDLMWKNVDGRAS
jgi:hypothetical protein